EVAGDDWFLVPRYTLPAGWRIGEVAAERVPIAFFVAPAYPTSAPYGFLAPIGMNCNGNSPTNTSNPPKAPPFDGTWLHYSWSAESWAATDELLRGSNLLHWCRSFAERFKEGA